MVSRLWTATVVLLAMTSAAWAGAEPAQKGGMFGIGDHYPIVLMAVPGTGQDFQHAKAIGANYVHLYGLGAYTNASGMKSMKAYLDLAQKYGLKVMFDLYGSKRLREGEQGLQEMRKIVDAFKDHPALGFWYLVDEPEEHEITPPATETFYKMLKAESPHVPVGIVTMQKPGWRAYQSSFDILSCDTYPVGWTGPFPQQSIERVTDFNHLALELGKPVLPCLQSFNQLFAYAESYADKGVFNGKGEQKILNGMRYPVLQELRYWNFATLVQGARGAIYYSYGRGMQTQLPKATLAKVGPDWKEGKQIDPQWMDDTFKPSVQELKTFTDLAAPAWDHQVISNQKTQNILEGIWKRGDKTYVVMVNNWPLKREVLLDDEMMAPFKSGKAIPWGFSRKVVPYTQGRRGEGWHTLDAMDPWEVLVWEIQRS